MTKEQQETLEQDRKDTREHIDSLSQEELDNIPDCEESISDEELQELQDSLDILLGQYTSNLDEIEKYKDILRLNIDNDIYSKNITGDNIITSEYTFYMIKSMIKQLNKENKILLKEIRYLEFDINYYINN